MKKLAQLYIPRLRINCICFWEIRSYNQWYLIYQVLDYQGLIKLVRMTWYVILYMPMWERDGLMM